MRNLVFQMKNLCRDRGSGSFETRRTRTRILKLVANQLSHDLGFIHMSIHSLKQKHVNALLKHWREQELSNSTIKLRMSQLRWWSKQIGKENVIARSNAHYGIENRRYVTGVSKAVSLSYIQINTIQDEYTRASVSLAKAFGLRKEEAIKIVPSFADKKDYLLLKASWCKGKRERIIPILNPEQREVLNQAKRIAGNGSLIQSSLSYIQQRRRYEHITNSLGFKKLHGLRHDYAQTRYKELTGWDCPNLGGTLRKNLTGEQSLVDQNAREIISNHMGHNRIQIVATYIG